MKTKIVATVGPASSSKEVLKKLIQTGVNVFRINFSHGTHADHLKSINTIKDLNAELNTHVAILADLQGPKIRIGLVENGAVVLKEGEKIIFTTKPILSNAEKLYISYPDFAKDARVNEDILLDDGKLQCKVLSTNGIDEVETIITHGGVLTEKKGVNLPNTKVSLPSLTEKDERDLAFILENELHWIALSFVRSADDIAYLKEKIHIGKKQHVPGIIAKIEKPEAIPNIDQIIDITDGIMVARGDLGVEVPLEQVPLIQKMLIQKCNQAAKPIIVATQMMESMMNNIRPSRAEVNDVANSVMDGTDAVMLSGETAVGSYPVEVIATMRRIIGEIEKGEAVYNKNTKELVNIDGDRLISDAILQSACNIAHQTHAAAIIAMTHTGYSASIISSQRPKQNIFIFSSDNFVLSKLSLLWGIKTYHFEPTINSTTKTLQMVTEKLLNENKIKKGDLLIKVSSTPIYVAGKTNNLKLEYA